MVVVVVVKVKVVKVAVEVVGEEGYRALPTHVSGVFGWYHIRLKMCPSHTEPPVPCEEYAEGVHAPGGRRGEVPTKEAPRTVPPRV